MKEYYYDQKELKKKKKRDFSFSSKLKGTDN